MRKKDHEVQIHPAKKLASTAKIESLSLEEDDCDSNIMTTSGSNFANKTNGISIEHTNELASIAESVIGIQAESPSLFGSSIDERHSRTIDGWILGETLGFGNQAKCKIVYPTDCVHKRLSHLDKSAYAMKIFRVSRLNFDQMSRLKTEVAAMKTVSHANVIKFIECQWDAMYPKKDGETYSVIYIVMELATGGELFNFLLYTGVFSEPMARFYMQQLMIGLQACHEKNVCHRDVKGENLLLDENLNLKIADFGYSSLRKEELTSQLGTPSYIAPEIAEGREYDGAKADIWSAGCILFVMLCGHLPFFHTWYMERIQQKEHERFWKAHMRQAQISKSARDLLTSIFQYNPENRPTIEALLKHSWMQGEIASNETVKADVGRRKAIVDKELLEKKKKKKKHNNMFKRTVYRGVSIQHESRAKEAMPAPYIPERHHVQETILNAIPSDKIGSLTAAFASSCNLEKIYSVLTLSLKYLGFVYKTDDRRKIIKATSEKYGIHISIRILSQECLYQKNLWRYEAKSEMQKLRAHCIGKKYIINICRLSGSIFDFHKAFSSIKEESAILLD